MMLTGEQEWSETLSILCPWNLLGKYNSRYYGKLANSIVKALRVVAVSGLLKKDMDMNHLLRRAASFIIVRVNIHVLAIMGTNG